MPVTARWIVYVIRMVDYKLIGWRWDYARPQRPERRRVSAYDDA